MITAANKLVSAIQSLERGGVILAPTDTVWGLICDFENAQAVEKMLKLKHSNPRPIALLCSDWRNLDEFGLSMPDYAKKLAEKFWPGAMTLVLKSTTKRIQFVAGSDNSIGIRMPDAGALLEMISEFGKPVAATSANFTGETSATIFQEIPEEIRDEVDYVCEMEIIPSGKASAVIDCTGPNFKLIRQGEINLRDIEQALIK
jgi:L-threonylcarbamoyladenylate synthase